LVDELAAGRADVGIHCLTEPDEVDPVASKVAAPVTDRSSGQLDAVLRAIADVPVVLGAVVTCRVDHVFASTASAPSQLGWSDPPAPLFCPSPLVPSLPDHAVLRAHTVVPVRNVHEAAWRLCRCPPMEPQPLAVITMRAAEALGLDVVAGDGPATQWYAPSQTREMSDEW